MPWTPTFTMHILYLFIIQVSGLVGDGRQACLKSLEISELGYTKIIANQKIVASKLTLQSALLCIWTTMPLKVPLLISEVGSVSRLQFDLWHSNSIATRLQTKLPTTFQTTTTFLTGDLNRSYTHNKKTPPTYETFRQTSNVFSRVPASCTRRR